MRVKSLHLKQSENKDNNELIGDCGLAKQQVDDKIEVEIGYHINKEYWSNGYASEAARACMEYSFTKEKETFIFNKNQYIYSSVKTKGDTIVEEIAFSFRRE